MTSMDLVRYLAEQTRNRDWKDPRRLGSYFSQFGERMARGDHDLFAKRRERSDARIMCRAAIATNRQFDGIEIISLSRVEALPPSWTSTEVREDYRKAGFWRDLDESIDQCNSFANLLDAAHEHLQDGAHRALTAKIEDLLLGPISLKIRSRFGFNARRADGTGEDKALFNRVVFDNLQALIYHFCAAFIRGDEEEFDQLRAALELYPEVLPLGHSRYVLLCLGH